MRRGHTGQPVIDGGHCCRVFDIPSGCAQGSPLSPLLYVIAAQPLAAKCRHAAAAGQGPRHQPAGWFQAPPCSHQHADDTTLHGETAAAYASPAALAVPPFCAASGGKAQRRQEPRHGLGAHPAMVGVDEETGVTFVDTPPRPHQAPGDPAVGQGSYRVCTSSCSSSACAASHTGYALEQVNLTLLGRCEVARQVLASCLVYHAQFVPVPAHLMRSSSAASRPSRWAWAASQLRRQALRCRPAAAWQTCRHSWAASDMWMCCHTSQPCRQRSRQPAAPAQARMEAVHARQPGQAVPGVGVRMLLQQECPGTDSSSTAAGSAPGTSAYRSVAGTGPTQTPPARADDRAADEPRTGGGEPQVAKRKKKDKKNDYRGCCIQWQVAWVPV